MPGRQTVRSPGVAPATIRPMNATPRPPVHLSVSIVLHNSPLELLRQTLRSLDVAARRAGHAGCVDRVSVELVDNASDPGYRVRLEKVLGDWPQDDFFRVLYTPQPHNRGFGHGHNAAISRADSQFHLVLNPDVELLPDSLSAGLTSLLRNVDVVLASPRVTGGDGAQEFLCKRYPSVLVLLLRGFAPRGVRDLFHQRLAAYEMRAECSGDRPVDVSIATGCFMLVRTDALQAVSGFNDNYFLYFEDFDLSLRLGDQGRLVFEPAMSIVHHGGYAASKGLSHVRYFIRSGLQFFRCHGWRWV